MVQTVSLPFSVLNNIPGVSGIQDVAFRVPEVDDIVDVVVENTLDQTDLDEAVGQAVDDIVDELPDLSINVPDLAEEISDELRDLNIGPVTIDIEGSLFDVEQDLVEFAAEVLEEAGLDFDIPDLDLSEVIEPLESLTASVDDIDVPTIADITNAAQDGAETALEDVLPDWLTQPLEDTVTDLLNALLEDVVDADTKQRAEDFNT